MTAIYSIFSRPDSEQGRVSFVHNGAFHYRGLGYAYVIRPTTDGAVATLRIPKVTLDKFRALCFRDIQSSKCPDMMITSSGFGWWKVNSLSEAGDYSVHRFFFHLNRWMLSQQARKAQAEQATADHAQITMRRRYTLHAVKVGHTLRIADVQATTPQKPATPTQEQPLKVVPTSSPSVDPSRLQQLVQTVNGRYGHVRSQSRNIH